MKEYLCEQCEKPITDGEVMTVTNRGPIKYIHAPTDEQALNREGCFHAYLKTEGHKVITGDRIPFTEFERRVKELGE